MRKYIYLTLAVISLLFASCTEKEPHDRLEVTSATDIFTCQGGEGIIAFESSSEVTSVQSSADWITATLRKNDILLNVSENKEITPRTATVTLSNKEGTSTSVEVSQKGAKYKFEAMDITLDAGQSAADMEYAAEDKMVVVIPDEAKSWLTATVSQSSLTIAAAENESIEERSAIVSYAISDKTGSFKVTQKAAEVFIQGFDPVIDFKASSTGGRQELQFKTNSELSAEASVDWITTEVTKDALIIDVEQNFQEEEREGEIQWNVAKSEIGGTIVVKQEKGHIVRVLSVKKGKEDVTALSSGFLGITDTVTVSSNTIWKADTDADWIRIISDGNSEKSIDPVEKSVIITVERNNEGSAREATVTFDGEGVEEGPVMVKVSQDGFVKIGIETTSVSYDKATVVFSPASEIKYVYGKYEKSKAYSENEVYEMDKASILDLAEQYSDTYTFRQVVDILCSTSEKSYTFSGLEENTDYVIYAFGIDYDLNLMTPVFTKDIKTTENQWKLIGTGKYTDGFVSGFFTINPNTTEVEVYENKNKPGHYAIKDPYGPKMLAGWYYPNATAEYLEGQEGNLWKSVMFEIHAEKPDNVYIIMQLTGFRNSTYGFQYGGGSYVSDGKVYTYTGCKGTLTDGKITFPVKGLRQQWQAVTNLYYGNVNGSFCLELPVSSPAVPKAQKVKDAKKTISRAEYLLKYANTPAPHAGWSVIMPQTSETRSL